jgi:toxin HigB-1
MIRSFKHRGLKRLHERDDKSGIRPDLLETVERILTVLDTAAMPEALNIPRYRLHPLKGDLKGSWAVTVRPIGASYSVLKEQMHSMLNWSTITREEEKLLCP